MSRFRVSSAHPEDLASGATFAPGETAVGVNPKDPHDARLIEEGRLVPLDSKPASKSKTKENEGGSQ